MNTSRTLHLFGALFALALLGSGCSEEPRQSRPPAEIAPKKAPEPPTKVSLQLNWFPEAEHGGYYNALVGDLYRNANLQVDILPGSPDLPVVQTVATGRADFGVMNADEVLLARAQGAKLVALFAPLRHSPRCIVVHASSPIERFEDLRGITLGMSPREAFAQYLQAKLPLDNVQIVAYAGNVAPFLANPNYAIQGYVFSEPYVIETKGGVARALMVSDFGFDPFTSLLVTTEDYLDKNNAVVRAMVGASVRGWEAYLENPKATNAYIRTQNPEMDDATLAYGVEAMRPLVVDATAEERGLGWMEPERWSTLLDQLVELKMIDAGAVKAEAAYTTRYLSGTSAPDAK